MAINTDKKYQSILGIVIGFLILYVLFDSRSLLYIALGVGLLCSISKLALDAVNKVWFKIVKFIGFINSYVVLGLVFFLVLIPVSFLYKVFKKDPLWLKNTRESLFREPNQVFEAKDLERPW